jgi:hypothetical protein
MKWLFVRLYAALWLIFLATVPSNCNGNKYNALEATNNNVTSVPNTTCLAALKMN